MSFSEQQKLQKKLVWVTLLKSYILEQRQLHVSLMKMGPANSGIRRAELGFRKKYILLKFQSMFLICFDLMSNPKIMISAMDQK